jgi:signal transduction histidine kinase
MKHAIKACLVTKAVIPNSHQYSQRIIHQWIMLTFLWLILSIILCVSSAHAEEPIHFTSAEILSTPAIGYKPPPYTVNDKDFKGTWQSVSLPHALRPAIIPKLIDDSQLNLPTIVTWYRLHVPKLLANSYPRFIYIPRWKTDGRIAVYGDSHIIYQSHANMSWNGWNIPLWIPLEETAGATTPNVILIRIERPRSSGGGISSIWLGEDAQISWRYHIRDVLQVQLPFMSSAAFLAVGIFSLFVWLKQRNEWLYILFFCVSLVAYLRSMHYFLGTESLPMSDAWFSWLTINSLFWLEALVHVFLNYLHGRPQRWLNWLIAATTLCFSVLTLPLLPILKDVYSIATPAYILLLIMGISISLVGWKNSKLSKSNDGLMLAGWGVVGMMFGIYDLLLVNNYISVESIYLGPYTNISAFLIFMIILFRRYIGAINTIKQQNNNLENLLQAQSSELQKNYLQLRKIEQRQLLAQERQRMMQDMHDGLGSTLISALRVVEHGNISEIVISEILKDCIDDLKLAIDSMESLEADLLLLLATLRYRIGPRLESSGIKLLWEIKDVPPLDWLDSNNALHILRILQEAFTNIIKHTFSTEIRAITRVENSYAVVSIIDNGQGFDVDTALKNGGRGLANQMRRAEAIGAKVEWNANSMGTCFTLYLPIQQMKSSKILGNIG